MRLCRSERVRYHVDESFVLGGTYSPFDQGERSMRNVAPLLLTAGIATAMLGCQQQKTDEKAADSKAQPGVEYTLVTLKVPHMK